MINLGRGIVIAGSLGGAAAAAILIAVGTVIGKNMKDNSGKMESPKLVADKHTKNI